MATASVTNSGVASYPLRRSFLLRDLLASVRAAVELREAHYDDGRVLRWSVEYQAGLPREIHSDAGRIGDALTEWISSIVRTFEKAHVRIYVRPDFRNGAPMLRFDVNDVSPDGTTHTLIVPANRDES